MEDCNGTISNRFHMALGYNCESDRGKVPFYCTAWSNIASKNNAIKCGDKTAWVEMTAIDFVDAMKIIGE